MSDLYIETNGSGPPLVLLHGWGLNVRVWDSLVPALASRFTTFAVDLPGHGRSAWREEARSLGGQARIVMESIQRALLAKCSGSTALALLGWSLGGQLALEIAASGMQVEPFGRVNEIILVATTPKFAAAADWPHGMKPELLASFAGHLATDYRQTVSDFLELQTRGSANGDLTLARLRSALFEHGEARPEALAAGLEILASVDLRPRLRSIQQRALVVTGQYDRVTSSRAGAALAASLPHASCLEIRRAGHAPFLSHTEQFIGALQDFLLPASSISPQPLHPDASSQP